LADLALTDLIQEARRQFAVRFGKIADGVAIAPGRINLIGEHTDYNDGFVLPMAINRFCAVAFRPNNSRRLHVWSAFADESADIDLDSLDPDEFAGWSAYVAGMAWAFQDEGQSLRGADLWIGTNLSVGAGVSSSAALEIAVGHALASVAGLTTSGAMLADLAHRADNEFVGIPSGIMDQFISANAVERSALLLDCRSTHAVTIEIPLNVRFIVIDTGKKRQLVAGAYEERVTQCRKAVAALNARYPEIIALRDAQMQHLESVRDDMDEISFRRAVHVIDENERPAAFASALAAGALTAAGQLMLDSHASLKDLYEVSCEELDAAVELSTNCDGVFGARMTGGGFGGCAIAMCRSSEASKTAVRVQEKFRARFGGAGKVYVVDAVGGSLIE